MSYSPIGDTVALTKLAYTLYSRVFVVARDAPEQFEDLLQDLDAYKSVLYRIRSQTDDARDPSYGVAVQDPLRRCFQTLYGLRDLTIKYENLAWTDRGMIFKRIHWAKEQKAIQSFRDRFKEDQQLLQLVLSSGGRDNLSGQAPHASIDDDKSISVSRRQSDGCTCGLRPIQKSPTVATTNSASTLLNSRSFSVSTTKTSCSCCYDHTHSGNCGMKACRAAPSHETSQSGSHDLSEDEPHTPNLWPLPIKTQQRLKLLQERERHNVPVEVQDVFRSSVKSVDPPLSLERWLRLAIWWLVKSRIVFHLLAQSEVKRRGTDSSQHQNRWHSTISAEQAYIDLLKSSWILEEIVLTRTSDEEFSYVSVRKMVKDLSASLHTDLREIRSIGQKFGSFASEDILEYDLGLLESFEQTIEAEESIPAAMDDPVSAHRWFEIDQDNAGMQHEKALFRTFVNAQLGSRHNRSKSPSAPYMLLVWTAADDCDLFVSLCNHRGSVNLSRKLVAEDLKKYNAGDDPTLFSIKFPTQEAEIKFLHHEDAAGFFNQPLIFLAALEKIKARTGELAIYQSSLSTYSDSSPQPLHKDGRAMSIESSETSSCGLRIYESMPDKCWKTTRRLVINTPPDSTKPECVSHWLPADHIKTVVGGTKVMVKWSDCGQLEKEELGNFNFYYAYVYKADEPNRKIELEFGSASEAQDFEKCLLLPTEMPPQAIINTEITSDFQDIRIYRLFDADEPNREYHSIALSKKNPKGPHTTEIYYAYRDVDWILSTKNGMPSIIDFPALQASHYVSNMPRLQFRPNASDPTPDFSDVVSRFEAAHFELSIDDDSKKFFYGLTGWNLIFCRPLTKLHLIETGHLIKNRKEQHKGVLVQLWEKAAEQGQPQIHLAIRLGEEISDRWITASLADARCRSEHSTASYNVEFPALLVKRGVEVDTKHMTASTRSGAKEEPLNKKRWKMTLTFTVTEHKDEFLRASGIFKVPFQ